MKLKINADIKEVDTEGVVSAIRGLPNKMQIREVIITTEEYLGNFEDMKLKEDDWNLANMFVYTNTDERAISIRNVKTFIQKVKEDIDKLNYQKEPERQWDRSEERKSAIAEFNKILDKRAGNL
ncbi:MAG: hypothetical protein AABX29_02200 [Nanoarchaeota archaeon]